MKYLQRIFDVLLKAHLNAMGAVLIEGPKWCGKTTTAAQYARSIISLQNTDHREEYLATAATKPSFLLEGDVPRLIDEWQDAPMLWDAVRTKVDERGLPGQFILTGSNAVDNSKIHHSGTGRISRMEMLPMSLWEYGESNGSVSLMDMFDNPEKEIFAQSELTMEEIIFSACRGGWPATLNLKDNKAKLLVAKEYIKSVYKNDISRIDGVKRNQKLTRMILKSYARNISTLAKSTSILSDVTAADNIECSRPTFESYIEALEKLFVIMDIEAWCPAIRSKTVVQSRPKRAFCDPSIAVAALDLTPEALMTQLKTFGFIFEQMCARDLRVYSAAYDGALSYYRDRYGLEADLVLHLSDGRYALIECKLGSREINDGAAHLLQLKRLIQEYNEKEKQVPLREPDLLIVMTGGSMAYTRPDGVKVIPLACLKD
ncbi:ATP-binding protein [Bacteroides sp. AN502(2024)]|uniref:ATP-binding protein n=1 Tax=Bacteroides sp. AN502(2024) TaxID=3160599 RepID=UPI0035116748